MLGIDPKELPEVQGEYAYNMMKDLRKARKLSEAEEKFYNFLKEKYEKEQTYKEHGAVQDTEDD
jgi:hypothetical protein